MTLARAMAVRSLCLLTILSFTNCAYVSEYRSPRDGRARVIWRANRLYADLGGVTISKPCLRSVMDRIGILRLLQLDQVLTASSFDPTVLSLSERGVFYRFDLYYGDPRELERLRKRQKDAGNAVPSRIRFWSPRFFFHEQLSLGGGARLSLHPSFIIAPQRDELLLPAPERPTGRESAYFLPMLHPFRAHLQAKSDIAGATIATLLLHAIVSLIPIIPIPFSLVGLTGNVGELEDEVLGFTNAYNDLSRTPGSACAYESAPGELGDAKER